MTRLKWQLEVRGWRCVGGVIGLELVEVPRSLSLGLFGCAIIIASIVVVVVGVDCVEVGGGCHLTISKGL